ITLVRQRHPSPEPDQSYYDPGRTPSPGDGDRADAIADVGCADCCADHRRRAYPTAAPDHVGLGRKPFLRSRMVVNCSDTLKFWLPPADGYANVCRLNIDNRKESWR